MQKKFYHKTFVNGLYPRMCTVFLRNGVVQNKKVRYLLQPLSRATQLGISHILLAVAAYRAVQMKSKATRIVLNHTVLSNSKVPEPLLKNCASNTHNSKMEQKRECLSLRSGMFGHFIEVRKKISLTSDLPSSDLNRFLNAITECFHFRAFSANEAEQHFFCPPLSKTKLKVGCTCAQDSFIRVSSFATRWTMDARQAKCTRIQETWLFVACVQTQTSTKEERGLFLSSFVEVWVCTQARFFDDKPTFSIEKPGFSLTR